mmetsp:Transcript_2352/g.3677  ORF Transcript_2352/g.3677 Transcript_2352/m.3677 type:complete len:92 (+) Transcript_2352:827-1102(+)
MLLQVLQKLPVKITKNFPKGGVPQQVKHDQPIKKELAPFTKGTILNKKLQDIVHLEVVQYILALKGSEAAIDAFCESTGLPWEAGSRDTQY